MEVFVLFSLMIIGWHCKIGIFPAGKRLRFFRAKNAIKIAENAAVSLVTNKGAGCYNKHVKPKRKEAPMASSPREGELYADLSVCGEVFTIYYGYYEEVDRESGDPIPLYPDLSTNPVFCAEGYPIVTQMQIACESYCGSPHEDSCGHCPFFEKAELLFGKCTAPSKRKLSKTKKLDETENKQ